MICEAVFGIAAARDLRPHDDLMTNLAVGTAAHGIGTARMLEVDRLSGAVSGLAIGLNGLITAFLLPIIFVFIEFFDRLS